MHPKDAEALETIDAAVINGDAFLDPYNAAKLQMYLDRWQRFLNEHEEETK
jgi:hypothetical protein